MDEKQKFERYVLDNFYSFLTCNGKRRVDSVDMATVAKEYLDTFGYIASNTVSQITVSWLVDNTKKRL